MNKMTKGLENVLKDKIKEAVYTGNKQQITAFADYLFEKIWSMPKERNELLNKLDIVGVTFVPGDEPAKTKRGRPSKKKPEPAKKRTPKKRTPKKKKEAQGTLTDEEIANRIAEDLKDEPGETVEVAEPRNKHVRKEEEIEQMMN